MTDEISIEGLRPEVSDDGVDVRYTTALGERCVVVADVVGWLTESADRYDPTDDYERGRRDALVDLAQSIQYGEGLVAPEVEPFDALRRGRHLPEVPT